MKAKIKETKSQLEFYGCAPKRFLSEYANKPRVTAKRLQYKRRSKLEQPLYQAICDSIAGRDALARQSMSANAYDHAMGGSLGVLGAGQSRAGLAAQQPMTQQSMMQNAAAQANIYRPVGCYAWGQL